MRNKIKLRNRFTVLLIFCVLGLLNACKSTTSIPPTEASGNKPTETSRNKLPQAVSVSGIIQEQGVTTYQYGTHVLIDENGKTLYALKSNTIQLNSFIGKKVQLQGVPVEDYPVDGGPDYLEVVTINE